MRKFFIRYSIIVPFLVLIFLSRFTALSFGASMAREEKRKEELEKMQERFTWWPTDATPAPQKDIDRGGYWWWPTTPGAARPWGNRGYIYVYKIIFDYKADELPPAQPNELRPSLLIKKIVRNIKIYFDYNKSELRDDAREILRKAVDTLRRNPETSILITGNCDIRGSEAYNDKLGKARAEAVQEYMLEHDVAEDRIRIVSRGKLDAVAPVSDLVGMQKDRNAQFMIAEVQEVMIPQPSQQIIEDAKPIDSDKYLVEEEEEVESQIRVETKEYVIQKNDSLWSIAQRELGNGYRWKYLYELNKDQIKDPNKLKTGQTILLPIE